MLMLEKLTKPVLVLNKSWTVIGTSPVYKALNLLFSADKNGKKKALIIDESCVPYTWEEWSQIKPENENDAIKTVSFSFKIPQIIRLTKYDKFPKQITTWENCVLSCTLCNSIKGNRSLHEVTHARFPHGMALNKTPIKPRLRDLRMNIYYESWKQWLDSAYWNVELENQN